MGHLHQHSGDIEGVRRESEFECITYMKILKIENVGRQSLEFECMGHLHQHSGDREGVGR